MDFARGAGVVLRPDSNEFVQVMRSQDAWVPGQIVEVVHDDGHEKVEHLNEHSVDEQKQRWEERVGVWKLAGIFVRT